MPCVYDLDLSRVFLGGLPIFWGVVLKGSVISSSRCKKKSLEASGQERLPSGCRAQLNMGMGFVIPFPRIFGLFWFAGTKSNCVRPAFVPSILFFARSLQSACQKGEQLVGGKLESKPCSLNLAQPAALSCFMAV